MRLFHTVQSLHTSLDYHSARHAVLASNVAHVDTPNYKPLDLERKNPFHGALQVALQATSAGHFGVSGESQAVQGNVVVDHDAPVGLDGNAVSLEREAIKVASNQLHYDTVASLVQNELSTLAWAANDGKAG